MHGSLWKSHAPRSVSVYFVRSRHCALAVPTKLPGVGLGCVVGWDTISRDHRDIMRFAAQPGVWYSKPARSDTGFSVLSGPAHMRMLSGPARVRGRGWRGSDARDRHGGGAPDPHKKGAAGAFSPQGVRGGMLARLRTTIRRGRGRRGNGLRVAFG